MSQTQALNQPTANGPFGDHSHGSSLGPSGTQKNGPSTRSPVMSQPQVFNQPAMIDSSERHQSEGLSHDLSLGPSRTQKMAPSTRPPVMSHPQVLIQPAANGSLGDHQLHVPSHGSPLAPQKPRNSTVQTQSLPEGVSTSTFHNQGGMVPSSIQGIVHRVPFVNQEVPLAGPTAENSHRTQSEATVPSQGPLGGRDGITFGKALLGGQLANGELRQRLQNMANRQRTGGVQNINGSVAAGGSNTGPSVVVPNTTAPGEG